MISLPKCKQAENCEQIAYVVHSTDDNPLQQDLYVCPKCENTLFTTEQCSPIPPVEPIIECLGCVDFHIEQICIFKNQYNLDKAWHALLPELRAFRDTYLDFRDTLFDIKRNNNWSLLSQVHAESKTFMNSLFESQLMKYYNHQLHCRSFTDYKNGNALRTRADQLILRARLQQLTESINTNEINPLRCRAEKAEEEVKEQSQRVQMLELQVEKLSEDNIQLQQQKDQMEQQKNNMEQQKNQMKQQKDNVEHQKNIVEQQNAILGQQKIELEEMKTQLEQQNIQLIKEKTQSDQAKQQQIDQFNQSIQRNDQEKQELESQLEEIKTELEIFKSFIKKLKLELTHKQFQDIRNTILKKNDTIDESSEIFIWLNNPAEQNLLKLLQFCKLPPLEEVFLTNINDYNKPGTINRFMANAISKDVKKLLFNYDKSSFCEISEYFPTLTKVFPQIPVKALVLNCKLTQEEFEGLLVAAKNSRTIQFEASKLSIESECEFEGKLNGSTFEAINFTKTGGSAYSNWKDADFAPFKNVVKGLSKVEDIRNRKITFYLKGCDITKDLAESILQEHGLPNAEIGNV